MADAQLTGATGLAISATEGALFAGTLATFSDPAGSEPIADYTATINWGGAGAGSTSGTIVSDGSGNYHVTGSYTYAEEGSYTVQVTLTHDALPSVLASSATATVADAQLTAVTGGFTLTSTEGIATGLQTVATFKDPAGAEPNASDPGAISTHYAATINWGDSLSSAGIITYDSGTDTFTVQGNHTYASDGNYTIHTSITHELLSPVIATSSATIADAVPTINLADPAANNLTNINEATTYTLTIPTPIDSGAGGGDVPTQYTINWGDGTPTTTIIEAALNSAGRQVTHFYSDNVQVAGVHIGQPLNPITINLFTSDGPFFNAGSLAVTVNNVAPTATVTTPLTAQQGSTITDVAVTSQSDVSPQDTAAGFHYAFDFAYNGSFIPTAGYGDGTYAGSLAIPGSVDENIPSNFLITVGNNQVAVRIIDKDGGFTDYVKTINVTHVLPTVSAGPNASVGAGNLFTRTGSFFDPGFGSSETYTATVDYGDGGGPVALTLNADHTFNLSHTYTSATAPASDLVTVSVSDGTGAGVGTFDVTVNPTTFIVTNFTPVASGFDITFNHAFNPAQLNIYAGGSNILGAADLTIVGNTSGNILGSLVLDSSGTVAHFVAHDINGSNILPADTYTVTLVSSASAWVDTTGALLDGDNNAVAGGNYVHSFTVASTSQPVLSIPDFARGPSQHVDVSVASASYGTAASTDLPVSLSDTTAVRSVDFHLNYDPTQLNFAAIPVILAPGMPGTWGVTYNNVNVDATHSVLQVTVSGTSELPLGTHNLVLLDATVPSSALYGTSELLTLTNVAVNAGTIAAMATEAVHKDVYFGDSNGDSLLTSQDASLVSRNVVHLDNGFTSAPLTDPVIISNVVGNGVLTGLDASYIAQKVVHLPVPNIPAFGLPQSVFATVDPTVQIGNGLGTPIAGTRGSVVSVPVAVTATEANAHIASADFSLTYDASRLTLHDADVVESSYMSSHGFNMIVNVDSGPARHCVYLVL